MVDMATAFSGTDVIDPYQLCLNKSLNGIIDFTGFALHFDMDLFYADGPDLRGFSPVISDFAPVILTCAVSEIR
jgi:hypothetical protein